MKPPVDGLEVAASAVPLTVAAVRAAFTPAVAPAGPSAPVAADVVAAAVLLTLVPVDERGDNSPAGVVLIRRAAHLRQNPGEIGFPGGRIESGEQPLAAALREAEEEVALSRGDIDVLGRLSPLTRTRSADLIMPFVAASNGRLELEANPDEVEAILLVPLAELLAPGCYWQERWDADDSPAQTMHFFDLGEDLIWGATSKMLYALFLRLLRGRDTSPVL